MLKEILDKVLSGVSLQEEEAYQVMSWIMEGRLTPSQIGGFLVGMRAKGETVEEVTGFARAMREKAVPLSYPENLIDTCGTGGDGKGTINISTLSALVVAGAGIKVAKHGNRSVSSSCGSADLLERLGVNINMPPEIAKKCLDECGFAFLFAPLYHPAMRNVAPIRRELGIRTVFNMLGPLTNPAKVQRQLLGVFSPQLTEFIAMTLRKMGVERAMIVSSLDGLDEISLSAPTKISELKDGEIITYILDPQTLGFPPYPLSQLRGGDIDTNVEVALRVLEGKAEGAIRDAILLNSSAALVVSGKAGNLKEGLEIAREALKSLKALEVLEKLRRLSKEAREDA